MIFYVANLLQTTNEYHQNITKLTKQKNIISRMNNQRVYFTALVSITQGADWCTPDRLPNAACVPIGTKCVNLIYNFIDSSQVIKSTFSTNLYHCGS